MAKILFGSRIASDARLRVGCSAIVLEPGARKVLLTRRADNGRWCLPGGGIDPGESAAEACAREVFEETGLRVRVTRLVGVYSSPDMVVVYADGNRWQLVALSFAAEVVGGELGLSDEVTECGYFAPGEIDALDLMEHHRERLADFFRGQAEAFVK